MSTILKTEWRIAAKEHHDDGSENILNSEMHPDDLTQDEREKLTRLRERNWVIPVGEKYLYQVGVFDGEFYAVHVSKDAHSIIQKYELYDEY